MDRGTKTKQIEGEIDHGSIGIGFSPMKTACSETLHGVPQYYGAGRKNARKKIRIVGSRQLPSTYQDDMVHIFARSCKTNLMN